MGKGPAVIRPIEHWKCRQKKWLEVIAVLKADTAGSLGLNHYSHFLRGPVQQSWCTQTLGPAGAGYCSLRYSHKLCHLPQAPQDKSAPLYCCSSVAPTEVGREGEEHRLARRQCTNCQVSLTCTEEDVYFTKASIMIYKTLNTFKSGCDSLAWCPGSCRT